jgi:hypothetical protein
LFFGEVRLASMASAAPLQIALRAVCSQSHGIVGSSVV